MKNFFILLSVLGISIPLWSEKLEAASVDKSVIRVNTTMQSYNLIQPWEKGASSTRIGLGAVLPEGKVLVTAQMVTDATYIELEKPDTAAKATAKVITVDYEANLALLEPINDNDFLSDRLPFELDTKLSPKDKVEAWQFEANGTPVITQITVSKGEVRQSFIDTARFLQIQANGPVKYRSGSFTLPVAKNKKLAGLLISYSSKDQISNILPASIIEHFLKDTEDGKYTGFPNLGIMYSQTLDEQFRNYLKLDQEDGGVFVSKVIEGASAAAANIKSGDVILSINGKGIDSRGNYNDPVWGKLSFSHLVRGKAFTGDPMKIKILREGQKKDINLKLIRRPAEDYLIDPYMFDRGPKFAIIGGLVFQELSVPFLKLFGNDWKSRAPIKMLMAHASPEMYEKEGRRKLVILTRTIPTPVTLGYERLSTLIVTKINGVPINDIQDVDKAASMPANEQHRIEFESYPKLIFLDAILAERVNAALEKRIGITKRLE
ncbi:MAG: PDZ domain-containing protein [Verrucomicrobiota bacterium]|nr:PDZ domain-containing protein [Verrucomicrobiota bacterium]MEE3176159.1 PDZ domain-containing protein [Verrucomicrobiota bacterium]